ncbi:MAG TPA: LPS export ABC transporter permease LptF [Gammaproteobacteria bacterium]|nr:LPS export ABC transporter permease LptF [Gammaproteobacteria bacterium]
MRTILGRYLFREALQTWAAVTGVLFLILLSVRFARFLGDAAAGELPGDVVLTLLALSSFNYLTVLIPLGLFLGIMFAFGRLYRDSEMAAMMACGIGPRELYVPLLALAGLLVCVLLALTLFVDPWAARRADIVRKNAQLDIEAKAFESGRFQGSSDGKEVFYAERVEEKGRLLYNVFLQSYGEQEVVVVVAKRGMQNVAEDTGRRQIVLEDGYRYHGVPGQADFRIIRFAQHSMLFDQAEPAYQINSPKFMSTAALLDSDDPQAVAELQWRFSTPLLALVLTLIAVPLARSNPREGRYGRLIAAVLVYVVYSNLLAVSRIWLERGTVPDSVGLWWVHGAFTFGALVLLFRQNGLVGLGAWRPRSEAA